MVEALAIYFDAVGIKSTIESLDEGKVASMWRNKEAAGLSGPTSLVYGLPKNGFGLRIGVKVRGIILRILSSTSAT